MTVSLRKVSRSINYVSASKMEAKQGERFFKTHLHSGSCLALKCDLTDRMTGKEMIVGSTTSCRIVMSPSSVRSRLESRVERARTPENSRCCPTARIPWRLETQAIPSSKEILCTNHRGLENCWRNAMRANETNHLLIDGN